MTEPCRPGARGWLAVRTPAPSSSAALDWQRVVQHVQSELTLRQVALCASAGPGEPLGSLRFTSISDGHVLIELSLAGRAIASRKLELASVPNDAHLLAIAVATDELLAANWAVLEEHRTASRARAVPAPRAAPRVAPPRRESPRFELGPAFAYEALSGGQTLLGAELRAGFNLLERVTLTSRVGFRQGLPERAPHGSLRSSGMLGGLGLRLRLVSTSRVELGLTGHASALGLTVSADAGAGATATDRSGVAVVLSAGPSAALLLSSSIRIALELAVGSAVRPVHVTDTGARVSGVSGLAIAPAGGVLVAF